MQRKGEKRRGEKEKEKEIFLEGYTSHQAIEDSMIKMSSQ